MMRTDKQAEASRANCRKSKGPVTPEGKRRSSLNNITHCLSGKTIVLTTEDPAEFDALRQGYYIRFQPADPVEADLVDRMVASQWVLCRAWKVETAALDHSMDVMHKEIKKTYTRIDHETVLYLGFKELSDNSTSLGNIQRYMTRLQRNFDRALAQLRILRSDPLLNPPDDMPGQDEPAEPAAAGQAQTTAGQILQDEPGDLQPKQYQQIALVASAAGPVAVPAVLPPAPLTGSSLGTYSLPSAATPLDFEPRRRRSILREEQN